MQQLLGQIIIQSNDFTRHGLASECGQKDYSHVRANTQSNDFTRRADAGRLGLGLASSTILQNRLVGTSPSLPATVNVSAQPMDSRLAMRLARAFGPQPRSHEHEPVRHEASKVATMDRLLNYSNLSLAFRRPHV